MTISTADMGVLCMAPVIILMAWCCNLDRLLEFDFAAVELAAIPYIRSDQRHTLCITVFFIKASRIFALAVQ